MGKIIGIDLGTTNSAVAIVDGPQPRILDNKEAKPQTRSVVGLKKRKGKGGDGRTEVLVGDAAVDNWPLAPKDTIVSVKRLMGRGVADEEVQRIRQTVQYQIVEPSDGTKDSLRVVLGDKQYSPVEVSALILKKLKEDAEFRAGDKVTHAIITVPAYFSQIQRDATRKAGAAVGLKVIKILDEPTAAAIAFGMESSESADPKYLLVYDLGGGTFDVSVLMWAGNVFAPLNLEGDMWLGGDNFDQLLVDHACRHVKEEFDIDPSSNLRFMVALRKACQAVKERLSAGRSADLIVTGMLQDDEGNLIDVELEVTREEFERMIRPLVDKTVSVVKKAVSNADMNIEQIDHVLMAGNATCVPLVQRAMEELFGEEKILRKTHPKHSVAMGAAILAARIGQHIVCESCGHANPSDADACEQCERPLQSGDAAREEGASGDSVAVVGIAPFYYGIQSAGDQFNVFIRKNDPYPTLEPQTLTFYTRTPDQRMISIPVYGGDNTEKASTNEKQGEAFAILPSGLPEKTPMRIRLWLDSDGVFDLDASLEDGTSLEPWILQGETDAKAVAAIEKIEGAVIKVRQEGALSPEDADSLENARNRAFKELQGRNPEGAMAAVDEVGKITERSDEEEGEDLAAKAERATGFVQFVLHQYSWVFEKDPNRVYRLNKLVEEVNDAAEKGDAALLKEKMDELDKAVQTFPPVINALLGIRMAITSRVQPARPSLAQNLLQELDEVEGAMKQGEPRAQARLNALAAKLTDAIKDAVKQQPGGGRCSKGHPTNGQRFCPHPGCGEDTWIVAGPGGSGGPDFAHG